jgi:hypothetical protein
MITSKTKLAVVAASALALAVTSQAQMAMPALSTTGFALGSYQHASGAADDRLNIDGAMIKFDATYKPVEGVVSLYYVPNSQVGTSGDIHLQDAYANVDVGSGWTVSAGRYLSWMGYESFYSINNPEITGGYLNEANIIAGYEEGVRAFYTDKDWNGGVSIEDSALNSPSAPYAGDGELKHAYGAEGYLSYTGIKDNTAWFGISYDSKDKFTGVHAQETYDLWDQYQLNKETYVAAELAYHDGDTTDVLGDALSWLVLVDYTFTDNVSAAFRVGGDENHHATGLPDDTKYTIAPTYTVNKNFSVRAELSYVDHASLVNGNVVATAGKDETTYGLQAVFKF